MAADKIRLEGMVFYGYHGVRPAERKTGQRFAVDLEVTRDLKAAGRSGDLRDTVSYSEIFRLVKRIVEGPPHNLLESLAGAIAAAVLDAHDVTSVTVAVKKPEPPIAGAVLGYAGVEITRSR